MVMTRIDALIVGKRLLDHPFYATWSAGTLSREALQRYAEQYYQWVSAFPTFLSQVHARSEDLSVRQQVLDNLVDEERGTENHPELWMRFCDALGLDRASVPTVRRLPETTAAIERYRAICRDEPLAGAFGALYAYESQQPDVMRTKRLGLIEHYGVRTGHDYFIAHETVDVEHSRVEGLLVERHVGEDASVVPAVMDSVRAGLDATYTLLDGVYDRYVKPA